MINSSEQIIARLTEAEHFAKQLFNLEGQFKALPGELDYNFHVVTPSGAAYILKIAHAKADLENLLLQNEMMHYLSAVELPFALPEVIPSTRGELITRVEMKNGEQRYVRLLNWLDGRVMADANPQTPVLMESLGAALGAFDKALLDFDHPGAHRVFKWDNAQAIWVEPYLDWIEDQHKRELAQYFFKAYQQKVLPKLGDLRKSVIYNDANDYNILVEQKGAQAEFVGLIDFGDAIHTQMINEVAIAIAYAAMDKVDPLEIAIAIIRGYHQKLPLQEKELELLYYLVATRLLLTVATATINQREHPENTYLQISVRPAWDLLEKWYEFSPDFVHYSFREACGLCPCHRALLFNEWVKANRITASEFVPGDWMKSTLDLSVGSLDLGNNSAFNTIASFEETIGKLLKASGTAAAHGGYGEIRPFYSTDNYLEESNNGPRWRTMHLGLDIWAKAGTPIFAPCAGKIHSFQNIAEERDYGPVLIVEHKVSAVLTFYTLYGHLSLDSIEGLAIGMPIKKGQELARIGSAPNNGNWPPHLHFQIMLDLLGNVGNFPGVAFYEQKDTWLSICPDPALWIDYVATKNSKALRVPEIVGKRKKHLGKGMSISYRKPLKMVRAFGQYLYDHTGRKYLDTVNNVAHVGHQHPKVVEAAQRQVAVLNTNTRYLHDNIVRYADELLATMPEELCVCHFVNSGSEANELALRMAKTYTKQKDILAVEVGYHGNTGACIDVSSYKFDGKGGQGAPVHTHIMPIPDTYRGLHRADDLEAGAKFAAYLQKAITRLKSEGNGIAGFICESILSCGGQIVLPEGYLKKAYEYVRAAGGLCIADEVQVGFGRVGTHFWGFELQGVVPDIVTMGKPIGNGHPLAAVVTTRAVADTFANGMEFFNTFGGNPVSCAIGRAVLSIIKEENLQENALETGAYLRQHLLGLQNKHTIIGDVRGPGFFQGIELVHSRESLEPAAAQASYLANRAREHGILMSTDGPYHNVLKVKPPMVFNRNNVDFLTATIDKILREDFCLSSKP